jgi:hypothetical protein
MKKLENRAHVHTADGRKRLLEKMKEQVDVDKQKYRDVLQPAYYFGYLDGQWKMIRLVEMIFLDG